MKYPSTRRESLQGLEKALSTTHPGLWLDKFIKTTDKEDTEAKTALVEQAAEIAEPRAYGAFFERYRQSLIRAPSPVYAAEGEALGRFVVGLGATSVLETSITLHRTYGVPYIPGSALKGLASSYAATLLVDEKKWSRKFDGGKTKRGDYQKALFGDTEQSGLIVFYDALPLPGKYRLDKDVVTVHHPEYYQGKGNPPADWDSPTPIPFITARGRFLFALGLNPVTKEDLPEALKWLGLAAELLRLALREEGVGAKTTIGYGRFKFEETFEELKPPPPKRSEAYEKLSSALAGLGWNSQPHEIARRSEAFSTLSEEEKRAFIEEHREKLKGILGNPKAPNTKVLKRARDSSGLRQLAEWLDLL